MNCMHLARRTMQAAAMCSNSSSDEEEKMTQNCDDSSSPGETTHGPSVDVQHGQDAAAGRLRRRGDKTKLPRPFYELIAEAILSVPEERLVLNDIYTVILAKFPHLGVNEPGWRNSIRHNLSLKECFVRTDRSPRTQSSLWAIHADYVADFRRGQFHLKHPSRQRERRKSKSGRKRGAKCPPFGQCGIHHMSGRYSPQTIADSEPPIQRPFQYSDDVAALLSPRAPINTVNCSSPLFHYTDYDDDECALPFQGATLVDRQVRTERHHSLNDIEYLCTVIKAQRKRKASDPLPLSSQSIFTKMFLQATAANQDAPMHVRASAFTPVVKSALRPPAPPTTSAAAARPVSWSPQSAFGSCMLPIVPAELLQAQRPQQQLLATDSNVMNAKNMNMNNFYMKLAHLS